MTGPLAGKRILIVEDEYFIASDLKRALVREGADVIGPVATLKAGLALVESDPVDAAVLDVNLEGDFSYAIADRLAEEAIPHMFLTGYDGWALPDAYRACPRIGKPFAAAAVVAMVVDLCKDDG